MTVATKIMMGSGAVDAYEIEQSLIFDEASDSSLGRTFSSGGNRKTWTYSTWLKIPNGGSIGNFLLGYTDGGGPWQQSSITIGQNGYIGFFDDKGGTGTNVRTNRLLRDPAAWYHLVYALDTTQGTAANRVKIYVNGVQETSFSTSTYPGQNAQPYFNSAVLHTIALGNTYNCSQQMAETHFIDGTALTPSSFGKTNDDTGQWIPKKYSGSYGTTGFYLKMASGALGTDSSGNSNTFGTTNLANHDVVIDTPTNNFATLNPLDTIATNGTISEGNLKVLGGAYPSQIFPSTISVSSGKWYAEFTQSTTNYPMVGVSDSDLFRSLHSNGGIRGSGAITWDLGSTSGRYYINSTSETANAGKGSNDAVIQVAFDAASRKVWFGVNNTWNASGNPAAGSNQVGVVAQTGPLIFFMRPESYQSTVNTQTANFGQKTFAYTPPSGFSALSTANLPDPAIPLPSAHFNTIAYTGDGSQDVTGVGFQPDLAWVKSRGSAYNHQWHDAVRGATAGALFSNSTTAATSYQFDSFDSDGFTTDSGNIAGINANGDPMVAWNWKANGSGSTDTSGDIDAVVSANQTAGFSIITWTGDGGAHTTVPHGLGVAPEIIFEKYLNAAGAWYTWVTAIDGTNDYLTLNTTNAAGDAGASGTPTSQFFSNWGSNKTNVAYAFASKPGFSKIGIYTGNGSATAGPFVNTGFKPAWLMYKITSTTVTNGGDWRIYDSKRSVSNPVKLGLYPNLANAEDSGFDFDLLSNGFKVRASNNDLNQNGQTFLYMAFAESPQKTATAR